MVTDYNNTCPHIYDKKGEFLKCWKCYRPNKTNALSTDSDLRLIMDGIVRYRKNKSDIVSEIHVNINFTNVKVYFLHVNTYENRLKHKSAGPFGMN